MNVPRLIRRLFKQPYDGLRHYGVVAEGVLYRCGQPTPAELAELIERLGLKTVISFRGSRDPDDPDEWERAERAVCAEHGAAFHLIPSNHKNPPTAAQAAAFLDICTDPAQTPVLVHCRLGQQRTLLFCGLYWVHVDGRDPDEVEQHIETLGFAGGKRRHHQLREAFRELARQALRRHGS